MNDPIEHDGHTSHWDDVPCQHRATNNYQRAIVLYREAKMVDRVAIVQIVPEIGLGTQMKGIPQGV